MRYNLGPNLDQIAAFSLLGQEKRRTPALVETRKNPPFADFTTNFLSPSTQ